LTNHESHGTLDGSLPGERLNHLSKSSVHNVLDSQKWLEVVLPGTLAAAFSCEAAWMKE